MKQLVVAYAFLFNPRYNISGFKKEIKKLEEMLVEVQETGQLAPIDSVKRLFNALYAVDLSKLESLIRKLKKKNFGQLDEKIQALEKLEFYILDTNRKDIGIKIESAPVDFENIIIKGKTALDWLGIYNKEAYSEIQQFVFRNTQGIKKEISTVLN